jgi:hypothetical protein
LASGVCTYIHTDTDTDTDTDTNANTRTHTHTPSGSQKPDASIPTVCFAIAAISPVVAPTWQPTWMARHQIASSINLKSRHQIAQRVNLVQWYGLTSFVGNLCETRRQRKRGAGNRAGERQGTERPRGRCHRALCNVGLSPCKHRYMLDKGKTLVNPNID